MMKLHELTTDIYANTDKTEKTFRQKADTWDSRGLKKEDCCT